MKRLTLDEAAEYLQMPAPSLRYRRAMNLPPRSYKVGKRIFFDVADLDEFIKTEARRTERGVNA